MNILLSKTNQLAIFIFLFLPEDSTLLRVSSSLKDLPSEDFFQLMEALDNFKFLKNDFFPLGK